MVSDQFARCNLDGRPIDPSDQEQVDRFAQFISMSDDERRNVAMREPGWRKWLGINGVDFDIEE